MAKQLIDLGTNPNDGTGSNLRAGGTIINNNSNEIYTAIGDGTDLKIDVSGASLNDSLKYNGTKFVAGTFPTELANDSTPQLGGSLDVNGNSIVSASNGNIAITPDGSGKIILDGLSHPTADGSSGQFLKTDGAGNLSFDTVTTTLTIADDSSTTATFSTGSTLKFSGGNGITTTVSNDEGSIASTGKISFQDDASTIGQVGLGEVIRFAGSGGVNTSISGNDLTISMGSITNANLTGSAGITNANLANSAVTLGSTSVSLGATAASAAGFSLTGASSLSGTGTIDLTSIGNKVRMQFANVGSLPSATTYEGMFATTADTYKAYYAEADSWIQLLSENESIGKHNDVDTTTTAPANGSVLAWNSSDSEWEPHNALTATTNQAVAQYDVTSSSLNYLFGDWVAGNNPTITITAGQTVCFNLDVGGSHPIRIQTVGNNTAGTLYNTGLSHVSTAGVVSTGSGAQTKSTGQLYWEVPMGAAGTYYYQCEYHQAMYGQINVVAPGAGGGKLLQQKYFQTGAVNSGTTLFVEDDTIPQNTEGDEYMTLAITPVSATSTMNIEVTVFYSQSFGTRGGTGLFKDSDADALAFTSNFIKDATSMGNMQVMYSETSGNTTARTYKVRCGNIQNAGTFTFNGQSGARKFGGTVLSTIRILEIEA